MLAAPSDRTFGTSRIRSVLTLERRFRAHLVVRERLVFDTRYAAAGTGGEIATLYLLMRGSLQAHDGPIWRGPVGVLLGETEFERPVPGTSTFRSWGDPSISIELRVALDDVRAPVGLAHGPIAVTAATWDALRSAYDALSAQASTDTAIIALVRALGSDGVVAADLADSIRLVEHDTHVRVWNGITPMVAALTTAGSIFDLAKTTGLSVRQLYRDIKLLAKTFGLPGEGFRDSMKVMRLRTAAVLMSAPGATATEVARQVGYGNLVAMGRAFREANLPQPSVIRDHIAFETMPASPG